MRSLVSLLPSCREYVLWQLRTACRYLIQRERKPMGFSAEAAATREGVRSQHTDVSLSTAVLTLSLVFIDSYAPNEYSIVRSTSKLASRDKQNRALTQTSRAERSRPTSRRKLLPSLSQNQHQWHCTNSRVSDNRNHGPGCDHSVSVLE